MAYDKPGSLLHFITTMLESFPRTLRNDIFFLFHFHVSFRGLADMIRTTENAYYESFTIPYIMTQKKIQAPCTTSTTKPPIQYCINK